MKFKDRALFILIFIGSLNNILVAQNMPKSAIDKSMDKATVTEANMNTASSPYRDLSAEEVINTMYPDPLAEGFMGKRDAALDVDRNRSVSDMLQEFEGQAKIINDATVVPDNIKDNHTKEEREQIEARAEMLLKEKALNDSADNKGEKRVKENPEATNEVLYKEELASRTVEVASESIVVEESQDINTAQIKEWPESNEDPEFSENKANAASTDDTEIIIVDDGSKPLPDEIPDYANMSGVMSEGVSEEKTSDENVTESDSEKKPKEPKKLSKRERLRKKMAIPFDPVLLTQGKPQDADDENGKTYSYSGILVPEKQPVTRRKKMIRWTLKLDDGTRLPLKSNLKLLQEVRNEENLEDYVTITGKMRKSALADQLKYFIPETIVKGNKGLQGEVVDDKNSSGADGDNKFFKEFVKKDEAEELASFSADIASDTVIESPSDSEIVAASDTAAIAEVSASETINISEDKAVEQK